MSSQHRFVPAIRRAIPRGPLTLLLVGLFVFPQIGLATWSESATTPLSGTQPTFINGSTAAQRKTGSLLLGSSARSSKLCLNADPTLSINDPSNTNCIDSWSDVAMISGPYVHRQQYTVPGTQSNPTTYGSADAGFAAVTGLSTKNQYLSTVAKINAASTSPIKYAVYATDGGSNARSAAQLSGKTVIKNAANDAKLCLNGQCIARWSDVNLFASTAVIRLQTSRYLDSDAGNASLSGVLWLQRGLNAGRPASTTPTSYTNTDGQCTAENGEDSSNSPGDCN